METNDPRPLGMQTLDPSQMDSTERINLWTVMEKVRQSEFTRQYAQIQIQRTNSPKEDEREQKRLYNQAVLKRQEMAKSVLESLEKITKENGDTGVFMSALHRIWLQTITDILVENGHASIKSRALSVNRIYEEVILTLYPQKASPLADEPRSITQIHDEFVQNNQILETEAKQHARTMFALTNNPTNTQLQQKASVQMAMIATSFVQNLDNVRHLADYSQEKWVQQALQSLLIHVTQYLIEEGIDENAAIILSNELMAEIVKKIAALPSYTTTEAVQNTSDTTRVRVRKIVE